MRKLLGGAVLLLALLALMLQPNVAQAEADGGGNLNLCHVPGGSTATNPSGTRWAGHIIRIPEGAIARHLARHRDRINRSPVSPMQTASPGDFCTGAPV